MARPDSRVSVGAVVNPLDSANAMFADYLSREAADKAAAENQRRWEITNTRAEDGLTRKAGNRAGLSQLVNTASKAMPAYALAGNTEDRDVINNAAVSAWDRTIAQSTDLTKGKANLDALQASGQATYEGVEAFRKSVMDTQVGAGGSQYKDIADRAYRGYTPSKEEANRALDLMSSGIKGIDPVEALAVRDKISEGYMTEADANKAFAASRKDALTAAKDERDYQFKVEKANQVAESKGNSSSGGTGKKGNQYGQIADAESELKTFMEDKEGYFRVSGLGTGNIVKELLQNPLTEGGLTAFEFAELKGIKPSEVTGLIKDAIVLTQKEGWDGYESPIAAVKEMIIQHAGNTKYKGTGKGATKIAAKGLPSVGATRDLGAERLSKAARAFGDIFPGGAARNTVPTASGGNRKILEVKKDGKKQSGVSQAEEDVLVAATQGKQATPRLTMGNVGLDLGNESKGRVLRDSTLGSQGVKDYRAKPMMEVAKPGTNWRSESLKTELDKVRIKKQDDPEYDTDNRIESRLNNDYIKSTTEEAPVYTGLEDMLLETSTPLLNLIGLTGAASAIGRGIGKSAAPVLRPTLRQTQQRVVAEEAKVANRLNYLASKKALQAGSKGTSLSYNPVLPTQPTLGINGNLTRSDAGRLKEWLRANSQ